MKSPVLSDDSVWRLLAWLGVAIALSYLIGYALDFIDLLRPILMPFLVGATLAYLGDPLADKLEARGLSRTWSVIVVFTALSLVLFALVLLLLPLLGNQIEYLQSRLPYMLDWLQDTAIPWIQARLGLAPDTLRLDTIRETVVANLGQTGDVAGIVLARVTQSGLALLTLLANLALIPVVTFYLLRDWDLLTARLAGLLPARVRGTTVGLARECDEVLSAFVRGQLLVMAALGCIYAGGLWLVGLKLALLIGFVSGAVNIVPYLGFIVGITAATIAAFFQFGDWVHLVLVWAVFLAGQVLEGTVLTPLLVGDRIGLHPVAVIFAVLAGGQLFGFVGVLLALPVAAVIMVLVRHAHDRYLRSTLYGKADTDAPPTAE